MNDRLIISQDSSGASKAPGTAPAGPLSPDLEDLSAPALRRRIGLIRNYGMLAVLIILIIVARALYSQFFSLVNLQNMLSQNAPLGIVGVGVTFVVIAAGFDLSVPALIGIGAISAAELSDKPMIVIFVVTLGLGLAGGIINGIVVTRIKVNPFIATLATGSIYGGISVLYTNGNTIQAAGASFSRVGLGSWLGLRIPSWIMLITFVIAGVVLAKTVYGRTIYAIGGNTEASRLAGLRVDLARISTYALSGVFATLAGLIIASTLAMGQVDVGQSNYALQAITVVVIGGTSLFGGEGAIWRTAVGLALLAVLTNLFNSLALNSSWQSIVTGGILIVAVAGDYFTRGLGR